MKVTRVLHVSVNVHGSLDTTRAFYDGVLELPSAPRPEIPGVGGHWFRIGGTELHLVDADVGEDAIAPTAHHWCVGVEDLTAAVQELDEHGIAYKEGAQGPVRQIWFCDPAGNVIELQEDRPAFLTSATIHEAAGRIGALPPGIKPVVMGMRLTGPAFPVQAVPGDNGWIHRAIYAAQPGDVLVVDVRGAREWGYWGEIMSEAATARRLGGLVIDGGVRDVDELAAIGFPVFAALLSIRGTVKENRNAGSIGDAVRIGDVDVRHGDLVVGDADGVVVVPAAETDSVMERAQERTAREADIVARIRRGERTVDLFGVPDVTHGPGSD